MKPFFLTFGAGVLVSAVLVSSSFAQVGKRYPSERSVVTDEVTGNQLIVLTNGKQSDAKIYPTHPQWTSDGKWIVIRTSGRAPGGQAYAVNEATGDIVQLTEGAGNHTGALNVARKSMKLYFWRDAEAAARGLPATTGPATAPATRPTTGPAAPVTGTSQLIELDLQKLLADSEAGAVKPASNYERICTTLSGGTRDGGQLAIDADEKVAYCTIRGGDVGKHLPAGTEVWVKPDGMRMGTGPGGLRSIDLASGEMKVITDTPFQIGHLQSNPFVSGEMIYCHETGGDAPQRIWTIKADGSGNRPLFVEGPDDWVTHEAVISADEVMFNLIGHQPRLRKQPTGIAVINLRTDAMTILGQIDERGPDRNNLPAANAVGNDSYGGFWHCNGSQDGRWAVGDTFAGNLYLVDRQDGRRILLTTDHKMRPDHLHPTFDESGTKIVVQSGKFTDGQRLQVIVVPVPPNLLQRAASAGN